MVNPDTDLIPSFSVMFFLWVMTVVRLIFSLSAISLLINPLVISTSTSISVSYTHLFRRQAIEKLIAVRRINYRQELAVWKPTSHDYPQAALTYLGNVMNTRAASFYREHGVQQVAEAYEKERVEDAVLMFCKHLSLIHI